MDEHMEREIWKDGWMGAGTDDGLEGWKDGRVRGWKVGAD